MGGSQWAILAWHVCCPEFGPQHQKGVGGKEEEEEEWKRRGKKDPFISGEI